MMLLTDLVRAHPLEAPFRPQKREACLKIFRQWLTDDGFDEWHLSLYPLASRPPLYFFSDEVIAEVIGLLTKNPEFAWRAISDTSRHINHAVSSLLRPAPSWPQHQPFSLDSPQDTAAYESQWQPEYQRYAEHVYNHLIQLPLTVLGYIHKKDYRSPALANRSENLRSKGLGSLAKGFDPVVRNAIAHGTTDFELAGVRYTDRTESKSLSWFEFEELFDALVDTCHGILAATLLFVANCHRASNARPSDQLPFGIRYLLTYGLACHPTLTILSMLETKASETETQLNIVCKASDPSRNAHRFESLFLSSVCCTLSPMAYHRYFIEIDSGRPSTSVIAIDGRNLSKAIREAIPIEELEGPLIESSLLWHDASRWRSWLATLKAVFRARMPQLVSDFKRSFAQSGLTPGTYDYLIIATENTSTNRLTRVTAYVALLEGGHLDERQLISTIRQIIRTTRRKIIRTQSLNGPSGIPGRPTHITVRLYDKPRRLRSMKLMGWHKPELVLIAEWSAGRAHRPELFTKQPDFHDRNLSIKYNPLLKDSAAPPLRG